MSPSLNPTTSNEASSGGGCPVLQSGESSSSPSPSNGFSIWNPKRFFLSSPSQGAQTSPSSSNSNSNSSCPMNPSNTPSSIEESLNHPQLPHPDQTIPLSTKRIISSIPRADELRPDSTSAPHQPKPTNPTQSNSTKNQEKKWVYPSEQQFYNAMKRKGWKADATTMNTVVRIHNAVNERGWNQIQTWEQELHNVSNPRLVRFLGRPNDTSPKAMLNIMRGKRAPFDRHDWFVDRGDGVERRYVIDFYDGAIEGDSGGGFEGGKAPVNMYLDVRPALDDASAVVDRMEMAVREMLPGIFARSAAVGSKGNASNRSDQDS